MSSVSASKTYTFQDGAGTAWSGNAVTLSAGASVSSQRRHHTDYQFGQTLHDGCVITGVVVQFNANGSNASSDQNQTIAARLMFSDGAQSSDKSVVGITTTSTQYTLGSSSDLWGMSSIRASQLIGDGSAGFRARITAVNTDTLFGSTDTVGNVTVVVHYTDLGRPGVMMFDL